MARTKHSKTKKELLPFIPTGSTLLNLAMSDKRTGGIRLGKMVNTIGDSSSGKTILALTAFAELARRKRFHKYRIVFDDAEAADQFDMKALFSERIAARIDKKQSATIEEFEANVMEYLDGDRPFFYVLDSFDALSSEADMEKAKKRIKARKEGEKVKGSYGMEKPKFISAMLSRIIRKLDSTQSVIDIISQTRDNISATSFVKKTRRGGRALKFYATHEMWMAIAKTLTKTVKGKKKVVGILCRVKITKNKTTGKLREIEFPIYYDYGIDDLGSCIDFLVAEGHWSGETKIKAKPFGEMSRAKLIRHIEDNNLETELKKIVAKVWHEGEEALKPNKGRKRKYS